MPSLSQWAREALNVVPAEESYRPLNGLSGVSSALAARCQGAAWFRGTAGATRMFAGDATKLYLLSGATWSDVTRLAAAKAITAITKANPGKVTVTAHGYGNGDQVFLSGVVGMTQSTASSSPSPWSMPTISPSASIPRATRPTPPAARRRRSCLCAGRRRHLALHPVRPARHRGERRRCPAGVRPVGRHALGGAGRHAAGRGLHHDGPRLRADGQDRHDAAARAVVGHQQRQPVGLDRRPTRPTSRTCPTAATSPAWSAASIGADLPGDQRAAHDLRGPADHLPHRQDRQRPRLQRAGQRRQPARHGVLPAQVGLLHGAGRPADHADRPRQGRPHLLGGVRRDQPLPLLRRHRSGARALRLRLSGQRQRRHAQPPADLQLAHREVVARLSSTASWCSAASASRATRSSSSTPSAPLETLPYSLEFVVLDRPGLAAAVRLRHGAQERLVLRPDAGGDRGDRRIQPGQRHAIRRARLPAADRRRQPADPARRARDAAGRRGLRAAGRPDAGGPGAGLPERPLFPRPGDAAGGRARGPNLQGIDDLDVRPAGAQ